MSGTTTQPADATERLDRLQTTPRRRFVLSYLTTRRRAVSLDELVTALDTWERVHHDPHTRTTREEQRIGLEHVHLPVLDAADVVSFDRETRLVELSVDPDRLPSLLGAPEVQPQHPTDPNGSP